MEAAATTGAAAKKTNVEEDEEEEGVGVGKRLGKALASLKLEMYKLTTLKITARTLVDGEDHGPQRGGALMR